MKSAAKSELFRELPSVDELVRAPAIALLASGQGLAALAEAALKHIHETAGRFSNLEFDVDAGSGGKRDVHVNRLFRSLLFEGATSGYVATAASAVPHGRRDR